LRLVGKVATARANGTFLAALVPLARQARRALTLIRLLTRTVTRARLAAAAQSRRARRFLADAAGVIAACRSLVQAAQRARSLDKVQAAAARLDGRTLVLLAQLAVVMAGAMRSRAVRLRHTAQAVAVGAGMPQAAQAGVGTSRSITKAP